jgi:hypothetical protein
MVQSRIDLSKEINSLLQSLRSNVLFRTAAGVSHGTYKKLPPQAKTSETAPAGL